MGVTPRSPHSWPHPRASKPACEGPRPAMPKIPFLPCRAPLSFVHVHLSRPLKMHLHTHMSFEVLLMSTNGIVPHVLMWNLLFALYKMPGNPAMSMSADAPHCSPSPPQHCITRLCCGLFHHSPGSGMCKRPPSFVLVTSHVSLHKPWVHSHSF